MIQTEHLEKSFNGIPALRDLTLSIGDAQVFGLIGTNGAGKSTLLRLAAGIYRPDAGSVRVGGKDVYDCCEAKRELFFIPDEPYFFPNSCALDMMHYYRGIYPTFGAERFLALLKDFGLDGKRPIRWYSKGMKKQLAVLCGLCSGTKYLLCDETFDGLDPVMRQAVKSLFAGEIAGRGLTPVIASHNLRELEDICDHVGLLHAGGLLLSEDLDDMRLGIQKVQCVPEDGTDAEQVLAGMTVLSHEARGRLHTAAVRGGRDEVQARFSGQPLVFFEILPLTLEEIFICETEVVGYDVKKLIIG